MWRFEDGLTCRVALAVAALNDMVPLTIHNDPNQASDRGGSARLAKPANVSLGENRGRVRPGAGRN